MLRPESRYPPYEDDKDLRFAYKRDELVPLPDAPKRLAFRPGRKMGSLARRLDQPKILYRGLRPEALATLLYIAKEYRRIAGHGTLRVTSTVRDLPYQELLVETNIQATSEFSLHTTGFAIDIAKPRAESVLRFLLERLQALDVIAWVEEPGAFHLTVGRDAEAFMPLYEALIEDQRPLPHAPLTVNRDCAHVRRHLAVLPAGGRWRVTTSTATPSPPPAPPTRRSPSRPPRRTPRRGACSLDRGQSPHARRDADSYGRERTRTRLEYGVPYRLERLGKAIAGAGSTATAAFVTDPQDRRGRQARARGHPSCRSTSSRGATGS